MSIVRVPYQQQQQVTVHRIFVAVLRVLVHKKWYLQVGCWLWTTKKINNYLPTTVWICTWYYDRLTVLKNQSITLIRICLLILQNCIIILYNINLYCIINIIHWKLSDIQAHSLAFDKMSAALFPLKVLLIAIDLLVSSWKKTTMLTTTNEVFQKQGFFIFFSYQSIAFF